MRRRGGAVWGRALPIGLIALPYFEHLNRVFAAAARQMIAEVLADPESGHEHAPYEGP